VLATARLAARRRGVRLLLAPVVVVVVLVALQNLLAELLLPLVDIGVEFVAVLSDRELLVVVNGNLDLSRAVRLVVGVVELGHVGMAESLLSSQALTRVELKQVTQKI